jgi:hypothetical protein
MNATPRTLPWPGSAELAAGLPGREGDCFRLPGVFDAVTRGKAGVGNFDARSHRPGNVVLVVKPIGGNADGAARRDFLDKHHAAARPPVNMTPHVISQIDFDESRVAGDREAEQARAAEAESDDAEIGLSVE